MFKAFLNGLHDRRGVAAVEFALIVPVLALVVAGINDGAQQILMQNNMHSGVSAAAQYVMSGGSDLSTAQAVGLSAWPSHSDSATMIAAKACYCGGATGDCGTLCPDQTVPAAYITITAGDTYSGWYMTRQISTNQTVRVR